jgi:hypothetical protein
MKEPPMTKFENFTLSQVNFALADIKETLAIWRDQDTEYTRKLWAEWDFLIVKKQEMMR